jgi:hypothetical protein
MPSKSYFIKHTTSYKKKAGKAIRQRDEKGVKPIG